MEPKQADLFVAVGGLSCPSPFPTEVPPAAAISEARAELGILRAQQGAEREHGFAWTDLAAEFLEYFATQVAKGQPFLIEHARVNAAARGVGIPANGRAWGAAVRRAKARGYIVRDMPASAHSSNGSLKWQWRAAGVA